jgi:protein gp37
MADRTGIEWTGSTWTPIRARNRATGKLGWHCVHVSPGCKHCYAESLNKPRGTGLPFKPGHEADVEIILDETMLLAPLRWRKPRKIFVCSMTDLFADFVSTEMIDRVFAVMALAPQHTFQVLTKRAARMRAYLTTTGKEGVENRVRYCAEFTTPDGFAFPAWPPRWPLPNVWLGVSAEDQPRADERVPQLVATPAAVRFVSAEPRLGAIDWTRIPLDYGRWLNALTGEVWTPGHAGENSFTTRGPGLNQIITGGESGPHARPMHTAWPRQDRDQCAAAGTAFFLKQWGEWGPAGTFHTATTHEIGTGALIWDAIPNRVLAVERDEAGIASGTILCRVGKKAAGRELDGVEHSAMPRVPPIWRIAPSNSPVTGEIGPGDDFHTILSQSREGSP